MSCSDFDKIVALPEALLQPRAFLHPVESVELIETHISWIVLAGDFVYKIKKPIDLGFLDFTTLDKRKFFCEEELRLNRPWAPDIYLDIVPITMCAGNPMFGGDGDITDYAVRMARFDRSMTLDRQLAAEQLSVADMRELATNIAQRHANAEIVGRSERRRCLELTQSLIRDNFAALETAVDSSMLTPLRDWTEQQLEQLLPLFRSRFDAGYYRDCHGDLHLANLIRLPGGITTFDCAEFSVDLRHIDVACDIAFLVMDLESHYRSDLAAHFLNRYLEKTGDYHGLRLFSLYFVYRCLVRAKVAAIRAVERAGTKDQRDDLGEMERYCAMASAKTVRQKPLLIVMHGLSGSGKTWVSHRLMAELPAIRIRSDIERKRMFGLHEEASSGSAVADGIYSRGAGEQVYSRLARCAAAVLRAGHNVILDAAFLQAIQRESARRIADECGADFVIVETTAPVSVLRQRIDARSKPRDDPSEADIEVLDYQLDSVQELSPAERAKSISLNSSDSEKVAVLASEIRQMR